MVISRFGKVAAHALFLVSFVWGIGIVGPAPLSASTPRASAKALYKKAMSDYQAFLAMRINSTNAKKQGKQIIAKIKAYDRVSRAFAKIAKIYEPEYTFCALVHLGEGKYHIAEAILTAPVPFIRGLRITPQVRSAFKGNIDLKFVQPLRKDAIKKLHKAKAYGNKYKLVGSCTNRLNLLLGKLQPKQPKQPTSQPRP